MYNEVVSMKKESMAKIMDQLNKLGTMTVNQHTLSTRVEETEGYWLFTHQWDADDSCNVLVIKGETLAQFINSELWRAMFNIYRVTYEGMSLEQMDMTLSKEASENIDLVNEAFDLVKEIAQEEGIIV